MICARCDGTGNELLAMYLRCTACSGTGEVAPCLVFTERDYVLTGDCEHTLPAGTVVESQDGRRLRGRVVGDGHPLSGWVWVAWQEYGTYDELIEDLTIIAP